MTVVLLDPRRPTLVPVAAIELLCGAVQYTEELPVKVAWSLPSAHPATGGPADTLLSTNPAHPMVRARISAGEKVIAVPAADSGERLLDAVAVMDRLRRDGPWEGEQTHESLRRYLLEETYELFDAIHTGTAAEVRDELGDVLLQVLFHARIAQDGGAFDIDDVADALVRKLEHRAPAVLGGQAVSREDQIAQWEQRKQLEKSDRESVMDGIAVGQPALALAQKVLARAHAAGLPDDVVPAGLRSVDLSRDDAEMVLRETVLAFMDTVRSAEQAIGVARGELGPVGVADADQWRAAWPR